MKQKDKELLLIDLCARLPYGVYVLVHDAFEYSTLPYENVYLKSSDISSLIDSISLNERYNSKDKQFNRIIREHKDFLEFKPYLRPMSSMTEKEFDKYEDEWDSDFENLSIPLLDWLNKNMFDYRGLIEKGLAIEVTEENNPYKN